MEPRSGCGSKSRVWICNGNFLDCCPLLCTMQGDGEVRSWLLGVHGAAHPAPFHVFRFHGLLFFSAARVFSWDVSTLPLSQFSPEGGKLNTSGFLRCYDHLLSPGYVPRASPIVQARCLAWSAGAVVAPGGHTRKAKPKGPRSGPVSPRRGTSKISAV